MWTSATSKKLSKFTIKALREDETLFSSEAPKKKKRVDGHVDNHRLSKDNEIGLVEDNSSKDVTVIPSYSPELDTVPCVFRLWRFDRY